MEINKKIDASLESLNAYNEIYPWIPNDKQKLTEWIKDHSDKSKKRGFEKKSTTYIETSLSLARKMIKSKEFNKQTRS